MSNEEDAPATPAPFPPLIRREDLPEVSALFARASLPRVLRARAIDRLDMISDAVAKDKAMAADLLKEATAQAESIRAKAFAQGHAQGVATALANTASLAKDYATRLANAEAEMVALSLHIAERIVRHKVALDPDTMRRMFEATLDLVKQRTRIKMLVHPEQWERVMEWHPRWQPKLEGVLSIEASDLVTKDGCVIETEAGVVDATLETQLAAIEAALLGQP